MGLIPDRNSELILKIVDGDHINGIPSHAITDPGADLAPNALVPTDPDGGNDRPGVCPRWFVVDTIYRTKGNTRLTPGARIVDDGHEARSLLFFGFSVVMGDILVHGVLPVRPSLSIQDAQVRYHSGLPVSM
jgi:hypothetical protein